MSTAIIMAFALGAVRLLLSNLGSGKRRRTRSFAYPAVRGLAITLAFALPFSAWIGFQIFSETGGSTTAMVLVFVISVWLLVLFAWPRTILIDDDGVSQRGPLGLGRRIVRWKGLAAAYYKHSKKVQLVGDGGNEIWHLPYHIDQADFMAQLRKRGVLIQDRERVAG